MLAKGLGRCTVQSPWDLFSTGAAIQVQWSSVILPASSARSRFRKCRYETVSERALTATWVIDEVMGAVQRGYRVLKINQYYEYEVTHYDPKTG